MDFSQTFLYPDGYFANASSTASYTISVDQRQANRKQMKQDFWDVYIQGEAMDIFPGKKK